MWDFKYTQHIYTAFYVLVFLCWCCWCGCFCLFVFVRASRWIWISVFCLGEWAQTVERALIASIRKLSVVRVPFGLFWCFLFSSSYAQINDEIFSIWPPLNTYNILIIFSKQANFLKMIQSPRPILGEAGRGFFLTDHIILKLFLLRPV